MPVDVLRSLAEVKDLTVQALRNIVSNVCFDSDAFRKSPILITY